jgi:hypothetical protein
LRPLTVGHLFVLLDHENAYPDRAEAAKVPDLITAVLVCSQRSAKRARGMIESRFARLGMKIWGALNAKEFHDGLHAAAKTFHGYLAEQLAVPQSEGRTGGGGGELRAPLAWRLMSMLVTDFHLKRDEAMKTPVSFALTLWATEADRRGTNKLASERQLRFYAWADEMEAIRLAGLAGTSTGGAPAQTGEGACPTPEQGGNPS